MNEMENFMEKEMEEWSKKCLLFDRNRNGLGFSVDISVAEDGIFKVKCIGLEEKYEKTINKLCMANMQNLVKYLYYMYDPVYAYSKEDYNFLTQKVKEEINQDLKMYLDLLFNKGFQCVLDLIDQKIDLMKSKYILNSIYYEDNKWKLPDGSVWNDGCWYKDGVLFANPLAVELCTILFPKYEKKEKEMNIA